MDRLTADDLIGFRTWSARRKTGTNLVRTKPHVAWRLLKGIVDLGHDTMLEALRFGQSSVPEMVDSYEVACGPVRDVLVRYLRERQSAMDYASLRSLARNLVKLFWTDIELHHPGITTLHLDDEIAAAWKQRLMVVRKPDGTIRPRRQFRDVLLQVRAFYLDIQEWATEDPSWAPWAVPSPVRKGDTDGMMKVRACF